MYTPVFSMDIYFSDGSATLAQPSLLHVFANILHFAYVIFHFVDSSSSQPHPSSSTLLVIVCDEILQAWTKRVAAD